MKQIYILLFLYFSFNLSCTSLIPPNYEYYGRFEDANDELEYNIQFKNISLKIKDPKFIFTIQLRLIQNK